jgi:RNA polymerase sigma-70 factor, ECF subfamily
MIAELDLDTFATDSRRPDWDSLYEEQLPRVYNFFRYRIVDNAVAEDLTAATFEKAWRHRGRYRRSRGAFTTWLFTIARNVATDYYRQHREISSLDSMAPAATFSRPAEEAMQRQDEIQRLATLLAGLPEREQELIALKYGAVLTNRAIGRLTGLSETHVGTLLHRTVQRLRSEWEDGR